MLETYMQKYDFQEKIEFILHVAYKVKINLERKKNKDIYEFVRCKIRIKHVN